MLLTERLRRAMAMKRRRCFMFTDVLTLDIIPRGYLIPAGITRKLEVALERDRLIRESRTFSFFLPSYFFHCGVIATCIFPLFFAAGITSGNNGRIFRGRGGVLLRGVVQRWTDDNWCRVVI